MEWTDISITVAKRDADTAEAIATMVANGGIYIEDYSDLEQQAWEIAHVDLIEQELLDKPRDVVIVHMYLAPDENPAEVLPLFEERLKNSGIDYQLNTTGVEQEDWQNGWKKFYHAMDIGERLAKAFPNLKYIDAASAAAKAGSAKAGNLVVLGALSRGLDFAPELWEKAIGECVKAKFLEMNLSAFKLGRELAA